MRGQHMIKLPLLLLSIRKLPKPGVIELGFNMHPVTATYTARTV